MASALPRAMPSAATPPCVTIAIDIFSEPCLARAWPISWPITWASSSSLGWMVCTKPV